MRPFSLKRALGFIPSIVLAVIGLALVLTGNSPVGGIIVISLAALSVPTSYLVLVARKSMRTQQQLVRRLNKLENANKRVLDVGNRSLRSVGEATVQSEEHLQKTEVNAQRLMRLEQLLVSQHDELTQVVTASRRETTGLDSLGELVRTSSEESRKHLVAIKRHLRSLEDGEHGGSLRRNLNADMAALVEMSRHVQPGVPLPVPSKWAMSPQVLELVLRVVRTSPELEVVVELGSGVSTAWVGDLLRARGKGRLVSLEHDPHFLEMTRGGVDAAGVAAFVDLRLAPLLDREVDGESFQWYDYAGDLDRVDLLVVDGPPGATGPAARYPALPAFASALVDGAYVILDDASRPEEKAILERWLELKVDGMHLTLVEMVDRAALLRVHRG